MFEALLLAVVIAAPDTSFVVAERAHDLTGDGVEETMLLHASGEPTDSLTMVLTIRGDDRELYRDSFVVDRVIGFDAGRRVASDEEWARVLEFYEAIFAPTKFSTPSRLLAERVISRAPLIRNTGMSETEVDAVVAADPVVFSYSPGGDRVHFLTWDPDARRFFDLYPCC